MLDATQMVCTYSAIHIVLHATKVSVALFLCICRYFLSDKYLGRQFVDFTNVCCILLSNVPARLVKSFCREKPLILPHVGFLCDLNVKVKAENKHCAAENEKGLASSGSLLYEQMGPYFLLFSISQLGDA